MRAISFPKALTVPGLCLALIGCTNSQYENSLQGVAKEWSKTIRASQVIPVYPLSEDIQVGDVYIVDVPSGEEQDLWQKRGYLPLPQLFSRLDITAKDYANTMYRKGQYGVGTATDALNLPQLYQDTSTLATVGPTTKVTEGGHESEAREARREMQSWKKLAPQASFPSYSVEVGSSVGGSIGLPVQGIPVALGLLHAQKATASVSMQECYTYGLPNNTIHELVNKQAVQANALAPDNLSQFAPIWVADRTGHFTKRYRYIRVITRVYAIGRIRLTVEDRSSTGGNGAVGLAQNLKLLAPDGDIGKTIDELNNAGPSKPVGQDEPAKTTAGQDTAASTTMPGSKMDDASTAIKGLPQFGGKLTFVNASDRSISMVEDFAKPMIVGYTSIDFPIGAQGQLGKLPIDTFEASFLGKGGATKDAGNISEFVIMNPDGDAQLLAWATYEKNKSWLKAIGFPSFADDPASLVKLYQTGAGWYRLAFSWSAWWRFDEVQRRITEDLLRCPPGFVHDKSDQDDEQTRRQRSEDFIKDTAGK